MAEDHLKAGREAALVYTAGILKLRDGMYAHLAEPLMVYDDGPAAIWYHAADRDSEGKDVVQARVNEASQDLVEFLQLHRRYNGHFQQLVQGLVKSREKKGYVPDDILSPSQMVVNSLAEYGGLIQRHCEARKNQPTFLSYPTDVPLTSNPNLTGFLTEAYAMRLAIANMEFHMVRTGNLPDLGTLINTLLIMPRPEYSERLASMQKELTEKFGLRI